MITNISFSTYRRMTFFLLIGVLHLFITHHTLAQSCVYSVYPTTLNFEHNPSYTNGVQAVYVDAPWWCDSYSADPSETWINVLHIDYENQIVYIVPDDNLYEDSRYGYVNIDGINVTVNQECGPPGQPGNISGLTTECINTPLNFSISSIAGATTYNWDISNGGLIDSGQGGEDITARFTNPGLSVVSVAGWNNCGWGPSRTLDFTGLAPTIVIGSNSPVTSEDTIKLTSSGGVSYSWTGPDNFTSTQQNPVITSLTAEKDGFYTVWVTDSLGCSNDTSTNIIISTFGGPAWYIAQLVGNEGVVGAIPGSFSQSPSGAVVYSIPVECPAGINGITPQLGLTYNSQAGNGIAGWGWNLTGLSSFTRSSKTIYYDGEVEQIKWDLTDKISFEGQRLFEIQSYDDSISYRIENNPKIKITAYDKSNNSLGWLKVWFGDGKIAEYKLQQNLSFLEDISETREYVNGVLQQAYDKDTVTVRNTLTWQMTDLYDQFRNFISYTYTQTTNQVSDSTEILIDSYYVGEDLYEIKEVRKFTGAVYSDFRLNEIKYGHDEDTIYTILCGYEDRDDPIKSYISGRKFSLGKRLNNVEVRYGNKTGNLIKSYDLNYSDEDLYSYLNSIELTGKDNEKFNKTAFVWEENSYLGGKSSQYTFQLPSFLDTVQAWMNAGYSHNQMTYYPADFNGDNLTDFFVVHRYRKSSGNFKFCWAAYINNGEPEYLEAFKAEAFWNNFPVFYLIDSDLDGMDELFLVLKQDNVFEALCFKYDVNGGFAEYPEEDIYININGFSSEDVILVTADFEGDGTPAHILLRSELFDPFPEIVKYKFVASGGFSGTCNDPNFNFSLKYELLDFNGNGKMDILFRGEYSSIWEYDKNSQTFKRIYYTSAFNSTDLILTGDFNSDGNSDILYFDNSNPQWKLLISDGDTQFLNSIISPPSLDTSSPSANEYCLVDVNQDGKLDIIELLSSTNVLRVYVQEADNFHLELTLTNATNDTIRFGAQGNSDVTTEIFGGMGKPFYYTVSQGKVFNVINTIYNGMGNTLNLTYGNYQFPYKSPEVNNLPIHNESDFYPVSLSNSFLKVLLSSSDNLTSTEYKYGNPVIHRNGKGFLGFEWMKSIKNQGDDTISVYQSFNIKEKGTESNYELLPDTLVREINGNIVSEAYSRYETIEINNDYYLVPDTLISLDKLNYNKAIQIFENYDNYLNPRKTYTRYYQNNTQLIALDSSINKYSNILSGDLRIFGLPDTATIYKKRPGETDYVRHTHYDYNSNGTLQYSYSEKNTDDEIKVEYKYDSFGNVTSVTKTATSDPDIPTALRSGRDSMVYSTDGRFLLKKINALDHSERFVYYEDIGKIDSIIDANQLKIKHYYDGFGRPKKTSLPGNIEKINNLEWSNGDSDKPAGSLYYSSSKITGSEAVRTFYDAQNRELRNVTIGFDGQKIYSDKDYNNQGQLESVSQPYFAGTTSYWTDMEYNDLGRISREDYPDGRFTGYGYDPRSVTITRGKGSNTQSTTKVVNGLGETTTVEDDDENIVETSYYASGLPKQTGLAGQSFSTTFSYNIYGNRDTISEPDAGQIITNYNVFGEQVSQVDAIGNKTEYTYDILGRLLTEKQYKPGNSLQNTKTYVYDTEWIGALTSVLQDGPPSSEVYEYDNLGRLTKTTESLDSKTIINGITYDDVGRMATREYPGEITITNHYNSYGYLERITGFGKTLWERTTMNALGQITHYKQGAVTSSASYDDYGELTGQNFRNARSFSYSFDDFGNLNYRKSNTHDLKEVFGYDNLNRLTDISYYISDVHQQGMDKSTVYDEDGLGNITAMTGTGEDFRYGQFGAGPHALTSVYLPEDQFRPPPDSTAYTCFNKIACIADTIMGNIVLKLEITYGTDDQRRKSVLTDDSQVQRTKYFFGDYEEITENGTTKKYYYVNSPTGLCGIFVKGNQNDTLWYAYTDHLGSLIYLVNADNANEYLEFSYDAWGNPREADDWTEPLMGSLFAQRGFTKHEHLVEFGLINMNGRVYDPALGRFLSPDPFVQDPLNSQNFNRYSYCLNNPLVYTDPDGEFFIPMLIGAAISVITNGVGNVVNDRSFFDGAGKAALIGGIGGAFSFGIGQAAQGMTGFGKVAFQTLAHGHLGGMMSGLSGDSYGSGFLAGGFGSLAATGTGALLQNASKGIQGFGMIGSGAISGGIGAEIGGGDFWDGFRNGAISSGLNHGIHSGAFGRGLMMSSITGRTRHLFGPDAIAIAGTGDVSAGVNAGLEKGGLAILIGKDRGLYSLNDMGVGIGGISVSGGVEFMRLYSSASHVSKGHFYGNRYEGNLSVTVFDVSVGVTGTYSKHSTGGGYTIGMGYTLSLDAIPFNIGFNLNKGFTSESFYGLNSGMKNVFNQFW